LYRYPLFVGAGFGEAACPNTDDFFDNSLSVPFYPWFDDDQVNYLTEGLRAALDELRGA
jgi:dTDP-4-amino-4,6-dideoxygalactose transaminase